jgi:aubergine-like protein
MPCPSQVVLQCVIKAGKNLQSIVTRIVMQMNAKMGGIPWSISDMPFTDKPTMVVGYCLAKMGGNDHAVGLAATVDREFTRYHTSAKKCGTEVVTTLELQFKEALKAFKTKCSTEPKQIIIYRDGVSESQQLAIEDTELEQIRRAIKEAAPGAKMLFCCVNKKVKTKYLLNQGRVEAPKPGTVVDHTITSKDFYDFYLVSTHAKQGVPTPTHYSVLIDEIGADQAKF